MKKSQKPAAAISMVAILIGAILIIAASPFSSAAEKTILSLGYALMALNGHESAIGCIVLIAVGVTIVRVRQVPIIVNPKTLAKYALITLGLCACNGAAKIMPTMALHYVGAGPLSGLTAVIPPAVIAVIALFKRESEGKRRLSKGKLREAGLTILASLIILRAGYQSVPGYWEGLALVLGAASGRGISYLLLDLGVPAGIDLILTAISYGVVALGCYGDVILSSPSHQLSSIGFGNVPYWLMIWAAVAAVGMSMGGISLLRFLLGKIAVEERGMSEDDGKSWARSLVAGVAAVTPVTGTLIGLLVKESFGPLTIALDLLSGVVVGTNAALNILRPEKRRRNR